MTSDDAKTIIIPESTQIVPAQPNKPVLRDTALPVAGAVSAAATLLWVVRKVAQFAVAYHQRKAQQDVITPKAITLDAPEPNPTEKTSHQPTLRKSRRVIYRASWSITVIQDE